MKFVIRSIVSIIVVWRNVVADGLIQYNRSLVRPAASNILIGISTTSQHQHRYIERLYILNTRRMSLSGNSDVNI